MAKNDAKIIVVAGPTKDVYKFVGYATASGKPKLPRKEWAIVEREDGRSFLWLSPKFDCSVSEGSQQETLGLDVEVYSSKSPAFPSLPGPERTPPMVDWRSWFASAIEFAKRVRAAEKGADGGQRASSENLIPLRHDQLMGLSLPPIEWLVEQLFPAGVNLLVGKPKVGKSHLAYQLVIAISSGEPLFHKLTVLRCGVLFIAMEEGQGVLQRRGLHFREQPNPENLFWVGAQHQWGKPDERLAELDGWLAAHPDVKLVVIDTLGRFIGLSSKTRDQYQAETDRMTRIIGIAQRRKVSFLLLHHARKSAGNEADHVEATLGSQALSGSADAVLTLTRPRGSARGVLAIAGREVQETELAIEQGADGFWVYLGPAREVSLSEERRKVKEALLRLGPIKPKALAEELGVKQPTMRSRLRRMVEAGDVVQRPDGVYDLPDSAETGATLTRPATSHVLDDPIEWVAPPQGVTATPATISGDGVAAVAPPPPLDATQGEGAASNRTAEDVAGVAPSSRPGAPAGSTRTEGSP